MTTVLHPREVAPLAPRHPLGTALGIVLRGRSYARICYLFATFPLGLLYFICLVIGLSVGFSTALILGFGLLVLVATMGLWWGFASFERNLVMWWIGVEIPPMSPRPTPELKLQQRLLAHLRNPVTWKSLVYLFVEFPFGIFSFALSLALVTLSLGLALLPLVYLLATWLYNALGGVGQTSIQAIFFEVPIDGHVSALALLELLAVVPIGLVLGVASLWLLSGLAFGWGQFARVMLGMSDTGRRLAEARAAAARAQATAARAEQSRRELIVSASHELRTPVASMRGHVESLLMPDGERPPAAEQEAYLHIIARESERLSALADDLLSVARADAHELRLDLRPVSVEEVCEEVYSALAPLARRERQVTLVHTIPPGLPPVWADRARLAQVLLNLMRNGISYTQAGGIVSLAAEQTNAGWVTLSVADTGIGIPREELPRVFERFYRADASRSRASGGFGLGLSIVKDLVQAMGGGISVESAVGVGTMFRVLLRSAPGGPSA
jgi:two-component system, OmpR family, phosphate regulon sensor histidine kinase PhoR